MIKSLKYASLSISLLLAAGNGHAQTALRGGLVENADVFMFMDVSSLNASAFSEAVEAQQAPADKALAEELQAKFTAATGLNEEDVLSAVFSMDIDDIDFQAQDPAVLETAQAVAAIELAKAITLEQAKAGIETMSQENEIQPNVSILEVDGLKVLKLASPQADQGPDQAFGTLSPDGKTVLFAFNTLSLKDGLARIAAETTADPTADMSIAMESIGKRQARVVLVLPPVARQKIQEGIQATAAQGGMGAMLMPFATAKSLIISANTAETMDFYLSLDLGNPGNATQAAGMVQSMLPMLMMGLGPQAAQISQKIQIAPQDSVVTVSINVTPEDIKMMAEVAQPAAEMNGME